MKRNNFSSLVKEEMVNRFESVVQEEIRANNLSIKSNQKDLDEANKTIQSLKEEIHRHKNDMDQLFNKLLDKFLNERKDADITVADFCGEVSKKISAFKDEILSFSVQLNECLSKADYEQRKLETIKYFDNQISTSQSNLENAKSYNEMMFVEGKQKREILEIKLSNFQTSVSEETKDLEKKIQTFKVDSTGVLEELRIYKKEMFIIDKKIENIYTLIERLQKREDLCHSRE